MRLFENIYWRISFLPSVMFCTAAIAARLSTVALRHYFSGMAHLDSLINLSCYIIIGAALFTLLWSLFYRFKKMKNLEFPKHTKLVLKCSTIIYFTVVFFDIILFLLGK